MEPYTVQLWWTESFREIDEAVSVLAVAGRSEFPEYYT